MSGPPAGKRLWGRDYILTLLTTFSFFASVFYLTTPLPEYVDEIGGEAWEVGLVTGAFAIVPLGLRPYVGRWSDRGGRKRLIRMGLVIMALSLAPMAVSNKILALLALRIVQGIGVSMVPTSAAALVAAVVPAPRRGEGMGFFGMAAGTAQMIGPIAGAWFASQWGFGAVFVIAGATAAAALLFIHTVDEPPTSEAVRAGRSGPLLPRRALFPSAIFLATTLAFTAALIFLPLLGRERDLGEVAFFFTVHGAASLIARPLGGRVSDRVGRVPVVTFGLLTMTVAMLLLASAQSFGMVLAAGLFSGAGLGSTQTGLFALALDRVPYEQQGGATAVLQLAWDVAGILAGVGFGVVATVAGVPAVFWGSAVLVAAAVVVLHLGRAGGLTAVTPHRSRPAA
jgi:MFS family permease